MSRVRNDYVRTAEAIQQGLNVVVKRIYKNDGGYTLINADSTAQSGWVYLGPYDPELEGDNEIPNVEQEVSEVLNYEWDPEQENAMEWWMDDYNSVESDNDTATSPKRTAIRDDIVRKYFDSRYSGDIFKFLVIMEQTKNNSGTSYMKAIGKFIGLKFGKEVIKALTNKLTIPFKDLKYIFRLPAKMNSWKDLKVNKQMDNNMKEKVRALNELHKGKSLKVIKGLKAIRQGKELPKGLSKQDVRNLTIIMLSKYKGKK